jgi:hypothetical protein
MGFKMANSQASPIPIDLELKLPSPFAIVKLKQILGSHPFLVS